MPLTVILTGLAHELWLVFINSIQKSVYSQTQNIQRNILAIETKI